MSTDATRAAESSSVQAISDSGEQVAASRAAQQRKRRKREERTGGRSRTTGTDSTGAGVTDSESTQKKRRSASRSVPSNTLAQESGPTQGSELSVTKRKRRKKRMASGPANHIGSLEVDLNDFADDVVVSESVDSKSEPTLHGVPQQRKHTMSSQPTGKVFIEQTGGFKTADKDKVARDLWELEARRRDEDSDDEALFPVRMTTMNTALQSQHVFKTITHYFTGILAGLSIAQAVFAYVWTCNGRDYLSLLCTYTNISLPVSCTFYFLLVLCIVATFDRYDIAKPTTKFLKEAATLRSGAVSVLLFFAALAVHMGMVPTDDKMSIFQSNQTLWSNVQVSQAEIDTWRILSIAKAVLICLAWFIISLRPGTNRLKSNLQMAEVAWVDDSEPAFKLREAKKKAPAASYS